MSISLFRSGKSLGIVVHLLVYIGMVVSVDVVTHSRTLINDAKIPNMSRCRVISLLDQVLVNCSSRSLQDVPRMPRTSTSIRLDHNRIDVITDQPFNGMDRLQSINISCNPLVYISPDLFKGLFNLQRISILHCMLYVQKDLDYKHLLSDVRALDEFALTFDRSKIHPLPCNSETGEESHISAITRASSLEICATVMLNLCGLDGNASAARTRKLTLWNNRNDCRVKVFNSQTFHILNTLEELRINNWIYGGLFLVFFETSTFRELENLRILKIINGDRIICERNRASIDAGQNLYMELLMHNITTSVSQLKNIEELRMEGLNCPPEKWFLNCSFALSGLSNCSSLRRLSLNSNSLSLMNCLSFDSKLTPVFKTLIALELKENCLGSQDIFNIITFFKGLKFVDARYQSRCGNYHAIRGTLSKALTSPRPSVQTSPARLHPSELQTFYFSHCPEPFHYWFEYHSDCIFNNLEHMEFSWLKDFKGFSLTIPANFLARRPNLQYLDLSGSAIKYIDLMAFKNVSSIKTLILSSNALGSMRLNLSMLIKDLRSLEQLHLANNGITNLSESVFRYMRSLTNLDLSDNLLLTFTPSIRHLTNLKLLNISYNQLSHLSSSNINDIETVRQSSKLTVDLTGNRFLCTCKTLSFLKWLVSTRVKLHDFDTLSCTSMNNQKVFMNEIKHEIAALESACESHTVLVVVCSVAGALCASLLVSALVYRYRWRLRYLYYMAKLRVSMNQNKYERIFEYDAFISYSSDDFNVARTGCIERLENGKGLRLFIHERDFTPGEAIAYNISVGIHSSKMTVFFISESFLSSEWCLYEFNMARMESLYSRRTVMLIVLLEKSVVSKLPVDVLDVIRSVTYLEYPEHEKESDLALFWNKMADCIVNS